MPTPRKYIVFWKNGKRIGSIDLTSPNISEVKTNMLYEIIQTDATDTIHLNIFGKKGRKRSCKSI